MTRRDEILKLIVEHYIRTAEPVSSKTLQEEYGLEVSTATIRNDMNALEKDGLLEKNFASSGRVPSEQGYRYYVQNLRSGEVDGSAKRALQTILSTKTKSVEEVLRESCEILSSMTSLASVVLGKKAEEERLASMSVVPINGHSATAIFVTDRGYVENKTFLIDETLKASQDGLYQSYGMQVGRTTRENIEKGALAQDEISYILMWTTAGIDARMNGSPCPTVGNAGSGSQGHINCAAPIASGRYRGCGEDEIIRAVALATLLNIYMDFSTKNFAYLSPMCYCASIGSVAAAGGVAFLHGFSKEQLVQVLRTGLCIMPGVICDGASKATCALRVHAGLSGAMQAMLIVERGLSVKGYEGFMNDELPVILENLYRLQKDGMAQIYPVLYRIRAEQNNIV